MVLVEITLQIFIDVPILKSSVMMTAGYAMVLMQPGIILMAVSVLQIVLQIVLCQILVQMMRLVSIWTVQEYLVMIL